MIREVATKQAPAAIGPYAQAVKVGEMIYTSGQIALTPEGTMVEDDIELQTAQVLKNLEMVLEAAGSSLQHVVKTTVYLTDMGDFLKMNAVYERFMAGHRPARATVEVSALPKNARVEIECIAVEEPHIPG